MTIDLSDKTQEEIVEYLHAILASRYLFQKIGRKVKIDRIKKAIKPRNLPPLTK